MRDYFIGTDVIEAMLDEKGLAPGRDVSVAGHILYHEAAITIANKRGLHCRYSRPNDYYTFSTGPLENLEHHDVLR